MVQRKKEIKMDTKKLWTKLLTAAALLALLLVTACAARNEIQSTEGQALVEQGDAYMACMKDGDLKCAYELLSPSAQQQVDQAKGMAAGVVNVETMFKTYAPKLSTWNFDQARFSTQNGTAAASLQGKVEYLDGTTGTVQLEFEKDGETWKVSSSGMTP
jgi:hypothetical protein